jgi:ArsC family
MRSSCYSAFLLRGSQLSRAKSLGHAKLFSIGMLPVSAIGLRMVAEANLAEVAVLVGDTARATMLSLARRTRRAPRLVPRGWLGNLLNRDRRTFRALPSKNQEGLTEKKALALMAAQPSMIKRPVLDIGGKLLVGLAGGIREGVRQAAVNSMNRRCLAAALSLLRHEGLDNLRELFSPARGAAVTFCLRSRPQLVIV